MHLLILCAKLPGCSVKSRLKLTTGEEFANKLYYAMLSDILELFSDNLDMIRSKVGDISLVLYFAPGFKYILIIYVILIL